MRTKATFADPIGHEEMITQIYKAVNTEYVFNETSREYVEVITGQHMGWLVATALLLQRRIILVVARKSRRFGMMLAHIPVLLSQKASTKDGIVLLANVFVQYVAWFTQSATISPRECTFWTLLACSTVLTL